MVIPSLEKEKVVTPEIILDPVRARSDDWLSQRKIFENTGGGIDISKAVTMIRNHAEVATINQLRNFPLVFQPQVLHAFGQSPFFD